MTDSFERLLEEWMDDVSRSAAQIDWLRTIELPPRRRIWRPLVGFAATAATVIAAIAVAVILVARPPVGGGSNAPAAVASPDARLARCGVTGPTDAVASFPMAHAADYHDHLPAMLLAPELDRPDPALVVVLRGAPLGLGRNPASGTAAPAINTNSIGTVCVVVGADATTAEINVYENVDLRGLKP
jgi:hypothetical protein